jgi:hypothetical protein
MSRGGFRVLLIVLLMQVLLHISSSVCISGQVILPQTGQQKCYTPGTKIEINCDGTGQDGDFKMGMEWPVPRYTDNNDGTVTDNLTGLIWLQHGSCGVPADGITWDAAFAYINALANGQCSLTDGSEAGQWRLPNSKELRSLIDYATGQYQWGSPFISLLTAQYWTATTAGFTNSAFTVHLSLGNQSSLNKTDKAYVLAVRRVGASGPLTLAQTGQTACYNSSGTELPSCSSTGQDGEIRAGEAWPSTRFTDNNNGAITDNLTGLVWLKNPSCFSGFRTWGAALNAANGLKAGDCGLADGSGAGNWRLPNVNELESLLNAGVSNSATWLNGQGFTNVQGDTYWSSTHGSNDEAWHVHMGSGSIASSSTTGGVRMWPVRGGGSYPVPSLPSVTTSAVSGITATTATGGGNVTSDGGDANTTRGVCWGEAANPVTSGSHTTNGTGLGAFTSAITGLTQLTPYHVRAYATNAAGTAYGEDISFTTNFCAVDVQRGGVSHSSISHAITSGSGSEIKTVARTFQESLSFTNNSDLVFSGGWACGLGSISSVTTIHGSMTIAGSGGVTVSNVAVY